MMKSAVTRRKPKMTDAEQVSEWMEKLDSDVKQGIELLRKIITGADPRIGERIKWNAPSYYFSEDIVTFGPRRGSKILLVFHHPHIVNIKSAILEGDYKDRRLAWFNDVGEIKASKRELVRILKEIVAVIASEAK